MMKATSKTKNHSVTGQFQHAPFQEFTVKTIEELVAQLEKVKPNGSMVEVTPLEEMHHNPCMQELTTVVVHTESSSGQNSPEELHMVYQYCSTCKQAVRIL